jgi:predicted MFS family arabinose efflux permease
MGIPIARLADRGNRRNIITTALGLWSIMTAFSGLSRNFIQLLLARIGVGVGEAGGSPPAHAMISDYFPPQKRATALSVYSAGLYLGVLVGFLMGGYLNQELGWRSAFFVLGIPGLIFCLIFFATVKEPQRGATDAFAASEQKTYSFKEVFRFLFSTKTFVTLALGCGLHAFCIYGLFNWQPSFLARLHGMKSAEIGLSLGLIFGFCGGIGTYVGGFLTDYMGKKDKRLYLTVPAYAILLSIVFAAGSIFIEIRSLSLVCLGVVAFLHSMYLGPAIAISHSLVPAPMRALTSAILFLVINLIGLGFGPLIVGLISDLLKPSQGIESLRWALSIILLVSIVASTFFFRAARKLGIDLH